MPRAQYANGDEITLTHCGCDGCSPSRINGVLCHEAGCPDAWRDTPAECWHCGCDYWPEDGPVGRYAVCPDCAEDC